jgi:protein-disulfide isomerase
MKRFQTSRFRFVVVATVAVALATGLIAASRISASGERTVAPSIVTNARPFPGVAQDGNALGDARAPVTLVEYADLQCPYCAEWARQTLPVLVDEYVRTGRLRIVFRGLAFLGPDSHLGLAAAVAAGRQDRLWDLVDALYARQGPENSGWISDHVAEAVSTIPGLDATRLQRDRVRSWVEREMARADRDARRAQVVGTPSFEIGPTGGKLESVDLRSLGPNGLRPAIEQALAR